jgi:hypothetical protein
MSAYARLIKEELDQRLKEQVPPRRRSVEFDAMASELALKHLDLTVEEIDAGIIDGGGDGGIDSAYVFVDQELVSDDSEIFQDTFQVGASHRNISVSLWITQAKEEEAFGANPIIAVKDTLEVVLDLDRERSVELEQVYSSALLDKIFLFRRALEVFRREHPAVSVQFKYVTVGDMTDPNRSVAVKLAELEQAIGKRLAQSLTFTELVGAEQLWQRLSQAPNYKADLRLENSFPYETDGERSYVGTVHLRDYLAFLTEKDGMTYRDYLFDGNVRHHEGGRASVNREIREAVLDAESPEFWWLNNGVTIICSEASSQGKTFTLDGVQIVNGLQTSRTVFDALSDLPREDPRLSRSVLVRVIEIDDAATINKVIRATNRQTPVREESLRATDPVQLHIEKTLLREDLYYDRRRNYYRNIGKMRSKIVSVKYLTQALLAIVLSKPDDARARPGDVMKTDAEYQKVYDIENDVAVYGWAIRAQGAVDSFLRGLEGVSLAERNDARFLISARIVYDALGYRPAAPGHVLSLGNVETVFTTESIAAALEIFRHAVAVEQIQDPAAARDRLSKNNAFTTSILKG